MPAKRVDEFDVYEFHVVVAEADGIFTAIGRDKKRNEVKKLESENLDELRRDIRQYLTEVSDDFVGASGAINQFLRAFPEGFNDPYFLFDERNYKVKAHEKAKQLLAENVIAGHLAAKRYAEIGESARKVFINIIFPNEVMAFKSFIQSEKNAEVFAPKFLQLLHGDDFDRAFDDMSDLLAPAGAAKWTILTYWPFILFPDRHMFMKPEVAQESARRLGDNFAYESRPSSMVYRKYLEYVARLRASISDLNPRDNIDVQTFMYAVGKSGFVRDGVSRREKWLSKKNIGDAKKMTESIVKAM